MSISLTSQQTLYLWYLIGKGGNWRDDIRPELDATERVELEKLGLITNEKRERESPSRSRNRKEVSKTASKKTPHKANTSKRRKPPKAGWIEITDKGWAWANDHLSSPLSAKTQSAGPILQAWLTQLHAFLRRRSLALADVIASPSEQSPTRAELAPIALEDRIRRAYLDATGGTWNKRVRLSELRTLLDVVQRPKLDEVLMQMQKGGDLVLYPLDNPQEITAADRDAAIAIGGTRLHIVYMRG